MHSKDHFEMREYSIDVVNEDGDSCVFTKGRPYPIYPSKKGLSPEFIRDIISRFASGLLLTISVFLILFIYI